MKNSALGVLFVAFAAAACSSSSGGGGGTASSSPVAPQDFPAQAAASICDNIGQCCMTAGFKYDDAACRQYETKQASGATKDVSLDGVNWDASVAGQCVALLAQIAAQCSATADQLTQLDQTCNAVTVGTKAPGEACTSSSQCAAPAGGQAYCPTSDLPSGGAGAGGSAGSPPTPTCQVVTAAAHATSGGPCNSTCDDAGKTNYSCAASATGGGAGGAGGDLPQGTCFTSDGLHCDFQTFKCAALVAVGGACFGSEDCAAGATCSGGTCKAPGNVGDACSFGSSSTCATGLYCDAGTQKCAAQKPAGAACTSGGAEECANGSCQSGKCVPTGQIASASICSGQASSTNPQPGGVGGSSSGGTSPGAAGTGP